MYSLSHMVGIWAAKQQPFGTVKIALFKAPA